MQARSSAGRRRHGSDAAEVSPLPTTRRTRYGWVTGHRREHAMVERVVVRGGGYRDPGTLMEASTAARGLDGVRHVAVGRAEGLDVDIIAGRHGYHLPDGEALGPSDVVIALRADSDAAAAGALATIDRYVL